MLKVFKKYLWLFEFIAAALILVLGVYVKLEEQILYLIVGVAITILGLFRVIPLLKTTDDRILKFVFLGEMILNIGIGVALILLYANQKTDNGALLGYLIGGVLYIRGLIYFFATIFRKEGTDVTKFITHIALLTVGTAIVVRKGFSESTLGWLLLGISILTAAVMIINGYSNYNNYRHTYRAVEKTKEIKDLNELELPQNEGKVEDIINEPQDEQQEEQIIQ